MSLASATRLGLGLEGHDRQDRAEELLRQRWRGDAVAVENGRAVERAVAISGAAAGDQPRAGVDGGGDQLLRYARAAVWWRAGRPRSPCRSGEPMRIASALACRIARNPSLTLRSTISREPATQLWPVAAKMPATWALAALSRSASAKTTNGDLPPSSSEVEARFSAVVAHDRGAPSRGRR